MKRTIISLVILFVALIAHGEALGNQAADYVAFRNNLEGVSNDLTDVVIGGGPSLSVDILRDGSGVPILSGSGNWQWAIEVVPLPTMSSLAVEIGFQLDELNGITPGDAVWDTSNPGEPVPGLSGSFDYSGMDDDGYQIDLTTDETYVAVGSSVLPANSDPVLLLLLEAGSAEMPTTLEVLGAFGADGISTPGTNGIIAQEDATGSVTTAAVSGTFTFIPEPASGLLVLLAAAAAMAVRFRSAA